MVKLSAYKIIYLSGQRFLPQRLNLMPQRAKNTLINFMWYRKAGLLRIFPLFSPETNKLGWTFYPQQNRKKLHEAGFDRYNHRTFIYSRIGK